MDRPFAAVARRLLATADTARIGSPPPETPAARDAAPSATKDPR